MNRHEKKFSNTDNRIMNALATLIEKKAFTDVTVSELCRKAEVNRTTFYAHFHSTADVLMKLENRFIEDFLTAFQGMEDPRLTQPNLLQKQTVIPYLEYVRDHRREYKLYHTLQIFQHDLHRNLLMRDVFVPELARFGQNDQNRVEYLADYYLNGLNAVIARWVGQDCADPIEEIYDIILSCVMGTSDYLKTQNEARQTPG